MRLGLDDGELLVRCARIHVEESLDLGKMPPELLEKLRVKFNEKSGVFTTIETYPDLNLRGCIGFPIPVFQLWKALLKSAHEAAFSDPRFDPVQADEMESLVFEVTVLSPPEKINVLNPLELPSRVEVGKHGLMVKSPIASGLLLPQVAVEYSWNSEEFLDQTCIKAGLPPTAWRDGNVDVYAFTGQIFHEIEPGGEVKEKEISSR